MASGGTGPMFGSLNSRRKNNAAEVADHPSVPDQARTKNTLEPKLLEQFECPVCYDYMVPPIKQCVTGHSVCNSCKQQLPHCSICRAAFGETRNFTLEALAANMIFSCKYKDEGCEQTVSLDKLTEHQAGCTYRPRRCPMAFISDKCAWEGSVSRMESHLKTAHKGLVVTCGTNGPCKITLNAMKPNALWCHAVFTLDGIFFSYVKTTEDALYASVFHVGHKLDSQNYKYQLTFETTDGCDRIISKRVTPNYEGIEEVIRKQNCLVTGYNFVKRCVKANGLFCFDVSVNSEAPTAQFSWAGGMPIGMSGGLFGEINGGLFGGFGGFPRFPGGTS